MNKEIKLNALQSVFPINLSENYWKKKIGNEKQIPSEVTDNGLFFAIVC